MTRQQFGTLNKQECLSRKQTKIQKHSKPRLIFSQEIFKLMLLPLRVSRFSPNTWKYYFYFISIFQLRVMLNAIHLGNSLGSLKWLIISISSFKKMTEESAEVLIAFLYAGWNITLVYCLNLRLTFRTWNWETSTRF